MAGQENGYPSFNLLEGILCKSMRNEIKSVKEGLAPILWLNWIYGLGIIEFPLNYSRRSISVVYILITKCMVCYIYYVTVSKSITIRLESYEQFSSIALLCLTLIVAFSDIILCLIKSKELEKVLARCELVDETLEKFDIQKNYAEIRRISLKWVFLWLISVMIFVAMKTHQFLKELTFIDALIRCVILSHPIQVHSVVDVSFLTFLQYLKNRFNSINNVIEEILEKGSMNIATLNKSKGRYRKILIARNNLLKYQAEHTVQTIRQLHLELCRITHKINTIFYLQILLQMATHFAQIIAALYQLYFLSGISSKSHVQNTTSLIWMIIWLSMYSLKLFIVNHLCGAVVCEAREINRIIQEIKHISYSAAVKDEIHQFCLQMLTNPLCLTACGWFQLNDNLTGRFFDKAATYLVILIQITNMQQS